MRVWRCSKSEFDVNSPGTTTTEVRAGADCPNPKTEGEEYTNFSGITKCGSEGTIGGDDTTWAVTVGEEEDGSADTLFTMDTILEHLTEEWANTLQWEQEGGTKAYSTVNRHTNL